MTNCSFLMALAASSWLMPAASVCAQEVDESKVRKVKAAYLYNFTKFVKWPDKAFENDEAPFVIGVLGKDPFGPILDNTVKGKKVAKRPIKTRRFDWSKRKDRT